MGWLFEARKRYGLSVLDYMVTSNHVHLLVSGNKEPETIPKSMQLIAGRTGQEYNQRKNRKGAFWEDRYHATAVESGNHLIQCMVYIDLNMVRAGIVTHPRGWLYSGYKEIQKPRRRYGLIDHGRLMDLTGVKRHQDLIEFHKAWIEEGLEKGNAIRDDQWTESLAVGGEGFVKKIREALGVRAISRSIIEDGEHQQLREAQQSYSFHFDLKKISLRQKISLKWNLYPDI